MNIIKVNFATLKSEYASNNSIFKGIGLRFLQANEICEKFFSLLIEFIVFREVNRAVRDFWKVVMRQSSGFVLN